jgi:hypothetical protein
MGLLLTSVALPAPLAGAAATTAATDQTPSDATQEIVVTGQSLFRDVQPERSLDEEAISSYGVSTVDELLGEVESDFDDDEQPLILVNGKRIDDPDQIGALPVEAVRNVQVLPRGTAVRLGGTSGQRVVSLTLAKRTRSVTLLGAGKVATDGDWHGVRGEAIVTDVRGSTRANLALRVRDESSLLESERGIIQPEPRLPFAQSGNVIAYPVDLLNEIDPQLSADAGQPVTVTPVPGSNNPSLADFIAGANQPATTDLGEFRTLRPRTRNYDLNGSFSTPVAPWLTATASFRLSRNATRSERGLPTALFVLSPDNPASPFSTDVGLAYYGQDPLHTRVRRDSGEANLSLDARLGDWVANFLARHSESRDVTRTERSALLGNIPIDDGTNPFAEDLSETIGITTDRATGRTILDLAQASVTGPALKLPAGAVQATVEGRVAWNRVRSRNSFGSPFSDVSFRRNEQSIRAALDVPLTSRTNNFLPELGELGASAEYSRVHFSDAGNIDHYELGLNWEPTPRLRFHGDLDKTDRPPPMQTLGYPEIATPGVRVFDPLTGETVDVVQITGGNPALLPETTRIWRLSGLFRLVPRLNLQANAEYTDTDARNFVSSLPEASAAVMLAFPGRFIRDPNGVLTTVDLRAVNFDSHREKRLRYGLSLNMKIGARSAPVRVGAPASRKSGSAPQTRLQLGLNHTIVFSDEIRIRPGLDTVDLLDGGAIGIAGGRVRHQVDGTAALTSGGMGVRLGATWRGKSTLESRIGATTDTLEFSPLFLLNIRAFADASRLFGRSKWARGMRLSLNVLNATNDRQSVRDSLGATPLQYQPGYRDPIGRTVELELRKVF